jgi:hypothetical protein
MNKVDVGGIAGSNRSNSTATVPGRVAVLTVARSKFKLSVAIQEVNSSKFKTPGIPREDRAASIATESDTIYDNL